MRNLSKSYNSVVSNCIQFTLWFAFACYLETDSLLNSSFAYKYMYHTGCYLKQAPFSNQNVPKIQ